MFYLIYLIAAYFLFICLKRHKTQHSTIVRLGFTLSHGLFLDDTS